MKRSSATAAIAAIAILISPVTLFAQGAGGSSTAGSTAGSPSAGSSGAGTPGISGAPAGPGANAGAGVTTGAAGTGTMARPQGDVDAAINEENKTIDHRLKGICRGC